MKRKNDFKADIERFDRYLEKRMQEDELMEFILEYNIDEQFRDTYQNYLKMIGHFQNISEEDELKINIDKNEEEIVLTDFYITRDGKFVYKGNDSIIQALVEKPSFQKNDNLEKQVEEAALPVFERGAFMGESIEDPFEMPLKDETSVSGIFPFKLKDDMAYFISLGLHIRIYDNAERIIVDCAVRNLIQKIIIERPGRYYWKVIDRDSNLLQVGKIFNIKLQTK